MWLLIGCTAGVSLVGEPAEAPPPGLVDSEDQQDPRSWTGWFGIAFGGDDAPPPCEGQGSVDEDVSGAFSGEGTCESPLGDELVWTFQGSVDDDGAVQGTALFTPPPRGDEEPTEFEFDLGGEGSDEELTMEWSGRLPTPDGDQDMEGLFSTEIPVD